MNRRLLYYLLTVIAGAAICATLLNTQFVLVGEKAAWDRDTPWELILTGWGAFTYAMGALTLAWMSDRFGRLPCIVVALAIVGIANVSMGLGLLGPYRLWQFFVFWAVVNLAFTVIFTSIEGLLSDYQDHTIPLARRLGGYCLSWSSGNMTAAFGAGHLKEAWGDRAVYLIIGGMVILAAGAAAFDWIRHGNRKLGHYDIGVADIRPTAPFHAFLGRIGIFFACIAYMAVTAAFPRYGGDFHGFPEGRIGAMIAVIMLCALCAFLLLSKWKPWHYRRDWQWGLQLPMLLGALIAIAAPAGSMAFIAIGFGLFGLGWGSAYFFSLYYSLTVPQGHAKSGGIHEAVLGLGQLAGPVAASIAIGFAGRGALLPADRVGVLAIWIAVAAVLVSLAVQGVLMRREQA